MESIKELKSNGIVRGHIGAYTSLFLARSARYETSVSPKRIVMGDCPYYWVVSPADAERLVRAGYEIIE